MPVGQPGEVWAQVLVKVEHQHFHKCVDATYGLGVKQHYLGGWYIKRVEVLKAPSWGGGSPPNPYSMIISVKAANGDTMVAALAEIRAILAANNASQIDVYEVDDLRFRANW